MIKRIHLENIRNIVSHTFECDPKLNLFVGPNGAGKTSMLEGIHFLSLGRSFRTHIFKKVIKHGSPYLLVQADLQSNDSVGIQKFMDSNVSIRKNGANLESIAELSLILPAQVIDPEAFRLMQDGPQSRRTFFDWGVYQMFPNFFGHWRDYQKLLKQRNAALRSQLSYDMVTVWDPQLIRAALSLDELRRSYLEQFVPVFNKYFKQLLPNVDIHLDYSQGWSSGGQLAEILHDRVLKDMELGYTVAGPHRYDVRIKADDGMAADIFSRGQQKLTVIAMKLAQASLCSREKTMVLLLDDIAAELDADRRAHLASLLQDIDCQCFITGVEHGLLEPFMERSYVTEDFAKLNFAKDASPEPVFHVEHSSSERFESCLVD